MPSLLDPPDASELAVWLELPEELESPEELELLDDGLLELLEELLEGMLEGMLLEEDEELEDCEAQLATTNASTAVPNVVSTPRKPLVIMMLPRCQLTPGL